MADLIQMLSGLKAKDAIVDANPPGTPNARTTSPWYSQHGATLAGLGETAADPTPTLPSHAYLVLGGLALWWWYASRQQAAMETELAGLRARSRGQRRRSNRRNRR